MDTADLQVAEQVVNLLRLRNTVDFHHQVLDRQLRVVVGSVCIEYVLKVNRTDDVVHGLMEHRKTGVAGLSDVGNRLIQCCGVLNHGNIRTRSHNFFGGGIVETENRVNHLLLVFFDSAFHFSDINPVTDFLFGDCRSVVILLYYSAESVVYPEERGKQGCCPVNRGCGKECNLLLVRVGVRLRSNLTEHQDKQGYHSRCNRNTGAAE